MKVAECEFLALIRSCVLQHKHSSLVPMALLLLTERESGETCIQFWFPLNMCDVMLAQKQYLYLYYNLRTHS